jgi:hypothetical protein
MKFTDLIKEDEQSEFDKVYKRTMTIFKAYRKGRIRTKSGIVFSYELPEEDTHISVSAGQGTYPTGFIMSERIKIKEECEKCSEISFGRFGDFIKRKFSKHDVHFAFNVYPEDIEKYEPQPINENFQIEKKLSKAKNVFKALRKGKIKVGGGGNPSIVYYELGNPDYKLKDVRYDGVVIEKDIHISIDKLVTYTDDKLLVQTCSPNNLDDPALRINILKQIAYSIIDKFQKVWDVVLFIGTLDIEVRYRPKEVQPINEGEDKLIKKAKTVYKALKRGKLKVDNQGVREDALFSYTLSDDPTIIKFENLSKDTNVSIKCEIYIKCLNKVANWTRETPVINHIKKKFKHHGIDIDIKVWTYNIKPYDEPINEEEDKNIKKVRSVLKGFKKGLLYTSQSGSKLYYELPDQYKILEHGVIPNNDNEVIFVQVGRETEDNCIKFFRESKEDENEMVRQDATNDMYENYKHILNLKLRPFNIRVIYKGQKGKWV